MAEDISVASSQERPSLASLHRCRMARGARSQPQGSKGTHKKMPSIALGPETWQASRFLQPPGIDERKQASGNLRSLLMTFTISPAFLR